MSESYDILGGRSGGGGELRSVAEVRFPRAAVVSVKLISLFESVLFYLPPEGGAIEAQFFGCFDAISMIFFQCPFNDLCLCSVNRCFPWKRHRRGRYLFLIHSNLFGQTIQVNSVPFAKHECMFDDIFKLPHVARIIVP
jgi:hypothetical protein